LSFLVVCIPTSAKNDLPLETGNAGKPGTNLEPEQQECGIMLFYAQILACKKSLFLSYTEAIRRKCQNRYFWEKF